MDKYAWSSIIIRRYSRIFQGGISIEENRIRKLLLYSHWPHTLAVGEYKFYAFHIYITKIQENQVRLGFRLAWPKGALTGMYHHMFLFWGKFLFDRVIVLFRCPVLCYLGVLPWFEDVQLHRFYVSC